MYINKLGVGTGPGMEWKLLHEGILAGSSLKGGVGQGLNMIKRLIFVLVLGGMLTVAKADTVVIYGHAANGDAAWNVNADPNDGWHSSTTFDRGFIEVADGTTIKYSNAFLDPGADNATGDWARKTNSGDHGDPFDFSGLHGVDWGAGDTHFDWGHRSYGGNDSGHEGSGSSGTVATPEPGTVFLLGAGLLGFAMLKPRK